MIAHALRHVVSTCLPHDNFRTVCPPGPVPTGPLPPIIVSSLMRSGTHLTIDLLLNNLHSYRNDPLYLDFDRYMSEVRSQDELQAAGNCIIKTHVLQQSFEQGELTLLKSIAFKGLVVIPVRDLTATQASLAKWNYSVSLEKLARDHHEQLEFWKEHSPVIVNFTDLLAPDTAICFLREVRQRLNLPESGSPEIPIMAPASDFRIFWSKVQTRLRGSHARSINTTIGFKT